MNIYIPILELLVLLEFVTLNLKYYSLLLTILFYMILNLLERFFCPAKVKMVTKTTIRTTIKVAIINNTSKILFQRKN